MVSPSPREVAMSAREYFVYTDGSCRASAGEARPGGWGYVVKPPKGEAIEGYGSSPDTHAKTMEYQAVAEGLAALPVGATACVYSDNQSLVESLAKKLRDWTASGFVNVDPLVVASVKRVAATIAEGRLVVRFQWVRAHNGNAGNERADALAAQGAREAKAHLDDATKRSR